MTGGGFGGSVVALAHADVAERLATQVMHEFGERTGREGRGFVCAAVDGVEAR